MVVTLDESDNLQDADRINIEGQATGAEVVEETPEETVGDDDNYLLPLVTDVEGYAIIEMDLSGIDELSTLEAKGYKCIFCGFGDKCRNWLL